MFQSEKEKLQHIAAAQEAGKHVDALRSNPVFKQAFIEEKAKLFTEFSTSKWFQYRLRNSLWNRIQAVNALENRLLSVDHAARAAKEELERVARKREAENQPGRVNRFGR